MPTAQEWLQSIKEDINKKHNNLSPKLTIDDIPVDEKTLMNWLKEHTKEWNQWILYKKTKDETFDLKNYFIDPPSEICKKILNDFFNNLPEKEENLYFRIVGDCLYDNKEARKEIFYLLKMRGAKISIGKSLKENDKKVYHLSVKDDSIENMLKAGYLNLEYSDC